MTDEFHDSFNEQEPEDQQSRVVVHEETTGIAWGFVAFLVFAALIAVFIIQNNNQVQVRFLWVDFRMSLGIVITLTVLATLTFDQLISFLYRRRKRTTSREARRNDEADGS